MKRIMTVFLVMAMVFSIVGISLAKDSDNAGAISGGTPLAPPSEWAKESVERAEILKITNNDAVYRYRTAITREEFCELIYSYCAIVGELNADDGHIAFEDTENVKVQALNAMGIISGKSATEFAPDDLLTREEAAAILFRMIDVVHPDWAAHQVYYTFDDSGEISAWAENSIQTICNMGIMAGIGGGKFAPKATFTTEQAIATLVRIYDGFNPEEVQGGNTFADKINAQMPTDENYMFSPISVKMALMMAANGASGDTQNEILDAVGVTSIDDFNNTSKELIERYSKTDILSLNIANSIWINKDKTPQNFSDSYKAVTSDCYDAEVRTVTNSDAAKEINGWVNDKTNGKIPTIISDANGFWAMLVNAIYFKGAWQDEFNVSGTKPDRFNNADGTESTIDFMNMQKWFQYYETKSARMIELPYRNRVDKISDNGEYLGTDVFDDLDVSMYLIMADGDIDVEQELVASIRDDAFSGTYIRLSMPKFKIEYDTGLNEILMNMGITTAFDEQGSDFTGMFDKGNMWFTDTIHKTFISVDEKGTEAAAVTAIHMAGSALPPEPIELKLDRPFYFVIYDKTSGETLFMGRYAFAE